MAKEGPEKRSYNQKSGDCPDGSIEKTAPKPRSPAGRETNAPRSAKFTSVRLKSRPRFQTTGRPAGKHCPAVGQASNAPRYTAHDQSARAGKQGLAAAQPVPRATADASVRAGKERPTSGREFSSAKSQSARPRRTDRESIRPRPFRLPKIRLYGRSSRTTV
ncbi:unnamed protein product [Microthlaspi erraticum]|uniref:Uncharacterized protein n=1 Tax=Microthlaspi erraticum TaxID=1685480 RepID=A0A6D2KBA4_9BRAS|nr:unnamed protein product [Microthlaspi erraticum]